MKMVSDSALNYSGWVGFFDRPGKMDTTSKDSYYDYFYNANGNMIKDFIQEVNFNLLHNYFFDINIILCINS